ncbi:MAG TPA: nucleotidyltransferase domain-containing protein [Firmicutes bacterium]|jgi:predicted nucleotidyltransferase|nr:nucleotidyltransferase domain-containing protein [Bacillota bacterium]
MGLMQFDEEKLKTVATKYGVTMLLLFGSRAQDNYCPDSDLDLGILFADLPSDLAPIISDLVSIFNNHTIDLVVLNHADPVLKFEIISNYKILYCSSPEIFINFYLNTIKQYNDIQKLLKQEKLYLDNFVRGVKSGIHQCHPPQID